MYQNNFISKCIKCLNQSLHYSLKHVKLKIVIKICLKKEKIWTRSRHQRDKFHKEVKKYYMNQNHNLNFKIKNYNDI